MRRYEDRDFPARDLAAMPAARAALLPWLIAGRLLMAPIAPRDGGLTAREAEAIEEMGIRLERDRRAGRLPGCTAFWFSPVDGTATPLTAPGAWLRVTALQHVVIDLHLLQAMGRVVPVTLLAKRVPTALVPLPPAVRGRPRKARVMAEIEAAA
jgi:hypothetical protein